ncbi:flagellar motor protein MotB [Alloyangia pacifica]|uniref:Chemotaxis protein MotB n=1 Tax=Alloyangia pacifica TaxID=311180 RepID=A0A1I6T0T2_9RHOB|nr:flagellar motor protein MotB [Alloyangia pacifica]SDG93385.1 chemotaxis protein MotB [Alloyangia pacifica]SFS82762.1 chemotaxis protein MotB [Alloyangia pacifica]
MAGRNEQAVIIKKIEETAGHGHHGGGWKVAYADFMTAMMAFFLLLWILAASDEEKLRGLADYFTPSLSEAGGRGDGLLDGMVLGQDGVMSGTDGPQSPVQLPSFGQENPLAVFDSRLRDPDSRIVVEFDTRPAGEQDSQTINTGENGIADGVAAAQAAAEAEAAAEQAERAEQEWQEAQERLEESITEQVAEDPELQAMQENLLFERTADGLEIQIVDKNSTSMFATGSARIEERTRELLRIVAEAIVDMPNDITISGHTDSVPYSRAGTYSNWELSADRANATRRVLVDTGVSPARITRISGLADTAPLDPEHPSAPENRRISVTLQYAPATQP